jgi:hypothetical protein
MIHYCHSCAVRLRLINPIDATMQNLTGSRYQLEKFVKHTAPQEYNGEISVFFSRDYSAYRDYTISGSLSGSLQIDEQNRKNLIWYAGKDIGITYENGIYKCPNDAVKVVLAENPTGIHPFSINYELQYLDRCCECGGFLPF